MAVLTNKQRAELIVRAVEQLKLWQGKIVKVEESLSHNRGLGGHDRHFSTYSSFEMDIEFVGWAFSGERIMILGKNQKFNYGIASHYIVSAEFQEDTISLIEHFETTIERLSEITLVE